MKKYILLIWLIISAVIKIQGQNISFNHLTTDEGLSQFSVNSMYVDEKGVIWIGTREGLNSYNGNDITTFKLQKNDPNSLLSNLVLQITGNHNGKIYVLCTDGVAELDLTTQKFTTLKQGNINGIYYKESLFISRKNEILKWNEKECKFTPYYTLPNKKVIVSFMHIDEKNNMWMGTEKDGVFQLSAQKELSHPIQQGNITSIYEDSNHELWIGSWEHGLYRILEGGIIKNIRHKPNDPHTPSSDFVRSCCEDNNGNVWIGTFNGLNCFDRQTDSFHNYTSNNKKESLTHSSIWCIVKDLQGTLWIGTYFGGVNYFNPEYEIYSHYRVSDIEREGLSSPIVGRMLEDDNGRLWICTEGGGVNVYNRKNGSFKWYRHENEKNSLSHDNVKAIYCDKKNEIMWIGTHLGGLNRLDMKSGHFSVYRFKEGDATSIPSDIIRDIIPYREKLIIATQNGVCLFDPKTEKSHQLFKDSKEGQNIKMVANLFIDKKGTLWIAATGEGVFAYRFETNRLTNYRHDPNNPRSISNNNINNIKQDSQGNLWFSTSGSGLDLFHTEDNSFENFDSEKHGLSSNCVYKVCESSDQKGHLLLITNQGFSQFDYPNKSFHNYNIENGFPLTAVNENALYMTESGEVFLGGVQGMISFHEKNLRFTPKPYNILFSGLTVNGKEVKPNDETEILKQSIGYTSAITLDANQSMFTVEFACSNYIPANNNQIVYRLEGFSTDWTAIRSKQRNITYTNLNPGTYTLIIKTAGENSAEVNEAQLTIKVLPPFYKTTLAYILYTLAIFGLLYYLFQTYKSRIKLQESLKYEQKHIQDLEELNQSKLRFFTNISHEFRTPLTLIVGQIETLLQVQSFTPSIYGKILGIYKSSLQLRELITELLDFRKQEQGHMKIKVSQHNIVEFIYENYLLFQEYARSKQINLTFQKETDEIIVWYDQKQLQKVVNNLLSNALKHTQSEDSIIIKIKVEQEQAIIEIRDTGTGIAKQDIDKIFDRFYQTEQLDSLSTGAGTGIGLALTKGIIELHHGKIRVESKLGEGSCFIVTLKPGNEHFKKEEISTQTEIVNQTEQSSLLPDELTEQQLLEEISPNKRKADIKMLIVEDNDSIKQMLTDIFQTFYQVITASDGEEALKKVREEMPDIVLSDIVMPRMSGTELCKQIKTDYSLCHIPVVLLTARTAIEHTIEGLRIGADDYITKPFNINILISRCNNLINSRILLQEKFSKQPQVQAQMLATNPMDKELLDKAMNIIEKHLDDTEFNVNIFASEMGMARTNLFTKLKAITGQTPNDFILAIRLKKGALLLRNNPELNISEISDRIGFSSSRYFSKCFKDAYRVSPLTYRKGEDVEGEETESEP